MAKAAEMLEMKKDARESREQAMQAFLAREGYADAAISPLKGDASFRRYLRLHKNGASNMLMDAPPAREAVGPYLNVARWLQAKGYSAPRILNVSEAEGFLITEDLGDDLFTRVLAGNSPFSGSIGEENLYAAAVDILSRWHAQREMQADAANITLNAYDNALLMQEVSLFSDWYLRQAAGENMEGWREEYLRLWQDILEQTPLQRRVFVHRDYHADNLMWLPQREGHARVGLLDFQDAVWGDPAYDLMSLLEDARRDVAGELRTRMFERYVQASGEDPEAFAMRAAVLAAQRNSKIIGIFVRLLARDGKPHYLKFLPRVWGYLEQDVEHPVLAPLKEWLDARIPREWRGALGQA